MQYTKGLGASTSYIVIALRRAAFSEDMVGRYGKPMHIRPYRSSTQNLADYIVNRVVAVPGLSLNTYRH